MYVQIKEVYTPLKIDGVFLSGGSRLLLAPGCDLLQLQLTFQYFLLILA